ncbi:hypothetical protein [Actinoplanes sp. NPDC051411]|uniref:hypothetical protein n=1 Tax=Actinoplanes sp. NPDC051411 TaxID=3155522 RepID=UPI00341876DA
MRALRPVVLVLSLVVAAMVAVAFLPPLLFALASHNAEKAASQRRAEIEQHVEAYAARVVAASPTPAGPPAADLREPSYRGSLDYVAERSGTALTALWVKAGERTGGLLGAYDIQECYTITFRDLGTAGATFQVTHLPDCRAVDARITAGRVSARPTPS